MTPEERQEFAQEIANALRSRASDKTLSEDEVRWVKLAIHKQEQSIKLRQAVIEKSLAGLVWAGILWGGTVVMQWAVAHGYKP